MKNLLFILKFIHQLAKLSLLIELVMILTYFGIYKSELVNKIILSRLILAISIPLIFLFATKYLINKIKAKQ